MFNILSGYNGADYLFGHHFGSVGSFRWIISYLRRRQFQFIVWLETTDVLIFAGQMSLKELFSIPLMCIKSSQMKVFNGFHSPFLIVML